MDVLYVNIKIAEIQSHNLIADPYDLPDRCVPVLVRTKEGHEGIMFRTGSRWYNANAPYGESYPLNHIEEWAPVT